MIANILPTLQSGLPVLLAQFAAALALLALGCFCYMRLTPFHETDLIRKGNVAAGVVAMGTLIALSLPIAATLASSHVVLDIVIWGLVALIIQLVAFVLATKLIRGLPAMIEAGNVAASLLVIGIQIAIAILNAGAMMG
jgi:putative membrane protein